MLRAHARLGEKALSRVLNGRVEDALVVCGRVSIALFEVELLESNDLIVGHVWEVSPQVVGAVLQRKLWLRLVGWSESIEQLLLDVLLLDCRGRAHSQWRRGAGSFHEDGSPEADDVHHVASVQCLGHLRRLCIYICIRQVSSYCFHIVPRCQSIVLMNTRGIEVVVRARTSSKEAFILQNFMNLILRVQLIPDQVLDLGVVVLFNVVSIPLLAVLCPFFDLRGRFQHHKAVMVVELTECTLPVFHQLAAIDHLHLSGLAGVLMVLGNLVGESVFDSQ